MAKVTDEARPYRTPEERTNDVQAITAAMQEAVREALLLHKKLGYPIAVWQNDRVEWIEPEDIEV
jgi:hypothetical protein